MRPWFFVIVLGLMAVLPAVSAASPRLDLTYNAVAVEGDLAFNGTLGVLEVAPKETLKMPMDFQLEAEEVTIIEAEDKVASVGGVFTAYPYAEPESRFFDATWNSTNRVPEAYLSVMRRPDRERPTLTMAEDCVSMSPLAAQEWSPVSFVTQRPELVPKAILSTPLAISECGSTWTLEVTGDFFLVDWEMKGRLQGKTESGRADEKLFESGFHPSVEAPEGTGGAGSYVQNFAVVENGRLKVILQEPKDLWLTVSSAVVQGVDLKVSGKILDGTAIEAGVQVPSGDFVAEGHNTLTVKWQDATTFVTQVQGEAIAGVKAKDNALPAAVPEVLESKAPKPGTTTISQEIPVPAWLGASIGALLVAAGVVALWFLKPWRTPNDLTDLGRQALQAGEPRVAWRLARAAVVRGDRSGKAEHVVAQANRELENYGGAMFWFTRANKHLGTLEGRAENAYQAAACAAKTGEEVEASTWLATANGLDLTMMMRAESDPAFEKLFAAETIRHPVVPDYLKP